LVGLSFRRESDFGAVLGQLRLRPLYVSG
jgi:hypothetical protein